MVVKGSHSRASSLASSEQTGRETPQSVSVKEARSKIHFGIIQNSIKGTGLRLELRQLQRQLAHLEATQQSRQLYYVSSVAGVHLDSIIQGLGTQISDLESRLEKSQEHLVRLPELRNSEPIPDLGNVETEMIRYNEQLGAWLRTFMAFDMTGTKPPAATLFPGTPAVDVNVERKPPRPPSLLAQVEERVTKLEERIDNAEEAIQEPDLISHGRNALCVDRALSAVRDDQTQSETIEETGPVAALQSAADELNSKLQLQAEQVALLMEKHELHKQQIAVLEAQRAQRRRLKLAMHAQLEQLETQAQERRRQLNAMNEQIVRLGTQQPERLPGLDEAILLRVRTVVDSMVQTEVVSPVRFLGAESTEAIGRRMACFQKLLQPALDNTSEIRRRATLVGNT